MNYLNVGCGSRFHPAWTNLDLVATQPSVLAHDVRGGIPFPENSFEVVYHSHVLEHMEKSDARKFIAECVRVLKPGGVLRVAVPDLERIVRDYLTELEAASSGDPAAQANYEWLMLELFDQFAREKSGGDMAEFLRSDSIPNKSFVAKRMGWNLFDAVANHPPGLEQRNSISGTLRRMARAGGRIFTDSRYRRDWFFRLFFRREYPLLQLGRFRRAGEIHRWMYDRFSLRRLLEESGLGDILVRGASDSYIPDWPSYQLDLEANGTIVKPDSLFMEGRKSTNT
jgi:predicted SAM-dependent methyltransferase